MGKSLIYLMIKKLKKKFLKEKEWCGVGERASVHVSTQISGWFNGLGIPNARKRDGHSP